MDDFLVKILQSKLVSIFKEPSIIRDLGSSNNRIALDAVAQLRELDSTYFLVGKDFHGANLQRANLSGINIRLERTVLANANLQNANLEDTVMDYADLRNADLRKAQMKEVHLFRANLRHAKLQGANLLVAHLHGADFSYADLRDTDLHNARMHEVNFLGADFRGAYLYYAKFTNANLENANFDGADWGEKYKGRYFLTLPDGTELTSEKDLERFTNPEHPEFWRPNSPVVWGDGVVVQRKRAPVDLDLHNNILHY